MFIQCELPNQLDDKFQNALHREIGVISQLCGGFKKVMFDSYIKADGPILTSVFFQAPDG